MPALAALALIASIGSSGSRIDLGSPSHVAEALLTEPVLQLDLGAAGDIRARTLQRRWTSSGALVWAGAIVGDDSASLCLALSRRVEGSRSLRGVLRRGDDVQLLEVDGDGELRVHSVETDSLPLCGNDERHRVESSPAGELDPSSRGGSQALGGSLPGSRPVIDVLVVYTPAARVGEGGVAAIEALIELAAAETNAANAASGLDHRVRIVHMAETNYVESGNHYTDLTRLNGFFDGHMDEVRGLRDAYAADCQMLITDGLDTCGNGYLWNDPPNPQFSLFASSVVSRHCAVSNLSFAHELGHNFGCDHEHGAGTGGAYGYSHGHRTTSGSRRTIMALPPGLRVPRFSDPSATWVGESLGVPAGQPLAADNVSSLPQVTPLVAGFRDALPNPVGEGMTTGAGTVLELAHAGSNEVAQGDFRLLASGGVPMSIAIPFYGHEPNAAPFFGGTLLTRGPLRRLPLQQLDGAGTASWAVLPGSSFVAGQEAFFQIWSQDPASPAGFGVSMSNGLRVEFR